MIDYQIACIDLDASGTYDAANRVETITAGGITTTYTYNGDGDRISQTVGTVETTYVLDTATPSEIWLHQISPTMVLSETNHSTNVTTLYWHALDTLAQSDGTTTEYFAYDGLGSVRQLVDATGSVGLAQMFDAYGNGYARRAAHRAASGGRGSRPTATALSTCVLGTMHQGWADSRRWTHQE
jgi:YD repeat-containing protein